MTEKRQTSQGYILSAFYNISQRNFGILLILWCSFKLWWNFCLDLSGSKFCSLGNRSIESAALRFQCSALTNWATEPDVLYACTIFLKNYHEKQTDAYETSTVMQKSKRKSKCLSVLICLVAGNVLLFVKLIAFFGRQSENFFVVVFSCILLLY